MLFWRSENSKLNSVEPRLEYAMAHNSNPHKFSPAHREYLLVILWNPKVNMLSGESPIRKARSHYYCFTEVGNSQHSSQFAAPLNKNRTKASIAESLRVRLWRSNTTTLLPRRPRDYPQSPHECLILIPARRLQRNNPLVISIVRMILPQVHLQKPCYDFSFL